MNAGGDALSPFDIGVSEVRWNSAFYSAMAVVSSASEAIQEKSETAAFPLRLWRLERKLRPMVDIIENPAPRKLGEAISEPVDPHKAVEQIESLVMTLRNLYQSCRRLGYTNRTLTAGSLNSIHQQTETIADFAERLSLIFDPKTDEHFARAYRCYIYSEKKGFIHEGAGWNRWLPGL